MKAHNNELDDMYKLREALEKEDQTEYIFQVTRRLVKDNEYINQLKFSTTLLWGVVVIQSIITMLLVIS